MNGAHTAHKNNKSSKARCHRYNDRRVIGVERIELGRFACQCWNCCFTWYWYSVWRCSLKEIFDKCWLHQMCNFTGMLCYVPGLGATSFLGSLAVRLGDNFEMTMICGGLYFMLWFRLKRSFKLIVFLWFEKLKLYSRHWGGGGEGWGHTATTIIPFIRSSIAVS